MTRQQARTPNIKRSAAIFVSALLAVGSLSACGDDTGGATNETGGPDNEAVTLEVATTWTAERADALTEILKGFTEETGIKVELVTPGDQYETVMKTRMGSGDLPDLWETHGWAVARYSEYLSPLNDQAWVDRLDPAIEPIVTGKDGNVYALPLTMGINTISYSKDAFDSAGVKAEEIRTWNDFEAACDKLLEAGITPIFIGNKTGDSAQLGEALPPTYLTNEGAPDNQAAALKDGTFSFAEHWKPISEQVLRWLKAGYFNVDILTADNEAGTKAMGAGKAAFMFGGSNNIKFALTFSPDANLGLLPAPSAADGAPSSLSMGEGSAYGVWKDTEHPDEARKLLDYLAQADVVSQIATAAGDLPGFADVPQGDDKVTEYFRTAQTQFEGDLQYIPLFDREYLPSGMWDDLTNSFTQILTDGTQEGVDDSIATLDAGYQEKYTG
ncbi:MAG: extracellular solute-binding protein [Bifidobacteriaceae bacterium]|jgi:raffinose/stachyose/melibiose transport system substrate-binding protein|nr:extracellular solute-binding protein [Bifidobacteriaceae bacterium]